MKSPIQIIGGGLSGLLLGIKLRREDVPVTIREAGSYPRHRVCGEFLSGNGVEILRDAGLLESLEKQGARWGQRVAFYSETDVLQRFTLPSPALCLSRFSFDRELSQIFQELGGDLVEGTRVSPLPEIPDPGTVLAQGRRRQTADQNWRWFGLKIHAKDIELEADLEMHLHPNAYIGACHVEQDRVNLCGLFRSHAKNPGKLPSPETCLRGDIGSPLWERTKGATFLERSRCAVAGLDLQPRRAGTDQACRIGDALTMIPPLTGNGMSMALESADAAVGPLLQFSEGNLAWTEALGQLSQSLDSHFVNRLTWARQIQRMLFSPLGRPVIFAVGKRIPAVWQLGFGKTR